MDIWLEETTDGPSNNDRLTRKPRATTSLRGSGMRIPGRMAWACVAHILSFPVFSRRDIWLFTPLTIE